MIRMVLANAKSVSVHVRAMARGRTGIIGCAFSTKSQQNPRDSRQFRGPRNRNAKKGFQRGDRYDNEEDDFIAPPEMIRSYEISDRVGQQFEYLVQPELADDDPEDEGADDDEFINPKLVKFPIMRDEVKVEIYARHVLYPEYWTIRRLSEHYNASYERTKAVIVLMHKRFTLMREKGFEVSISIPSIDQQAESLLEELNALKDAKLELEVDDEEGDDDEEDLAAETDDADSSSGTESIEGEDRPSKTKNPSNQKKESPAKLSKQLDSIQAELEKLLAEAKGMPNISEVREFIVSISEFSHNLNGVMQGLQSDSVEASKAKLSSICSTWKEFMDSLEFIAEDEITTSLTAVNIKFQDFENLSETSALQSRLEETLSDLKVIVDKLERMEKDMLRAENALLVEQGNDTTADDRKFMAEYKRSPAYEIAPIVNISVPQLWLDLKQIYDELPEEGRDYAQVIEKYNLQVEDNQKTADEKKVKCTLSATEVATIIENLMDHYRRMENIEDHEEELQEYVYRFPQTEDSEGALWPPRFEETPRYNSSRNGKASLTSKYFPRLLNDQSFNPAIQYLLQRIEKETKGKVEYSRQYYRDSYESYQKSLTEEEKALFPKVDFHKPSRWKIAYKNLSLGKSNQNHREHVNIITRTGKFRKATPLEEVALSWNKRPSGIDEDYTKNFPFARSKYIDPYVDPDREDYLTKKLLQDKIERRQKAKAAQGEKK